MIPVGGRDPNASKLKAPFCLVVVFFFPILNNFCSCSGSVGVDLARMIERFSRGIEFTASRDAYELDYGVAQIPIGRVSRVVYRSFLLFSSTFSSFGSGETRLHPSS